MGSAACYQLASRGQRVLGIERYTAGHNQGSSHGDSRIIRQAYYESPAYVPLVQRAYELWEKLERETGLDLLRITGGLMIGHPNGTVVRGTLASAKEHNLPYEALDGGELRRRYPAFEPRDSDVAVFEERAGYLRPEAAVRAHLAQAGEYGAELHFEEEARGWRANASGAGVQLTTGRGTYEADRLVIAPGAWAPELLQDLGVPFVIRRHVMCWFAPTRAELFSADRFPIYMWDVDGRDCFYGFPATGGPAEGVKVALHSGGDPCTPRSIDRTIRESDAQDLRQYLAPCIPALNGPLLRGATCMYTMTPDEHFVLGLHPRHPQVAVAAGFSGHGFKFASAVGEILADLATKSHTNHPIDLFSPARFHGSR